MSINYFFSSYLGRRSYLVFYHNPHVHTLLKSGNFIHRNEIVEMWKTQFIIGLGKLFCGKLYFPYFHIQINCELFYNVARNQVKYLWLIQYQRLPEFGSKV